MVVGTTTTNAAGEYLFNNLTPGSYSVQFVAPTGFIFTTRDAAGSNDANDSDANVTTGDTIQTVLESGENDLTWDAGVVQRARIGDTIFLDKDADGIQDAGEGGIGGVTVNLCDAAGNIIGTTTTDANGKYFFDVAPGTYGIKVTPPAGYVITAANQGADDALDSDIDATGKSSNVTVASGQTNNTLDGGLYQNASLGNRVWVDTNGNGIQDGTEVGIANVTVFLKNAAGVVVGTTTTNAAGEYLFNNLKPGTYSVQFVAPTGYIFTTRDAAGSNDANDSDANITTGDTIQTVLESGENDLTWDAGVVQRASLGDRVWLDCDMDGIQDAGEPGVAGVTVQLKNASGAIVATTSTDVNGNYLFNSLMPGDYSVTFVKPANYSFTTRDAAGSTDANDSDADTVTGNTIVTTLVSGENDLSWDAGLTAAKQCLTFDFQGNTALDGPDGNTRTYTNSGVAVTVSAFARKDVDGAWSKAYLGAYGGGLGVTDNTEGSGSGNTHTVDNVNGTDNYVVFTFNQAVTLDKAFLGYVVGDSDISVWIGNVSGAFATPVHLSDSFLSGLGFKETNTTTSTSARTADLNAGNLSGNVIVIAAQDDELTNEDFFKIQSLDVCTIPCAPALASIGNRIWYDNNANGIQDAGEGGVAGVQVELRAAVAGGVGGAVIATTTTDANGNYLFTNVTPGNYQIDVNESTLPAGFEFTTPNVGDDANDSDVQQTASIPLNWGVMANTTLSAGETDLTWDAGIFKRASLGDRVWLDCDMDGIQDSFEPGVSGVTVQLKNAAGTVVATTTTDAHGNYLFNSLIPGDYRVTFVKPTNYSFTTRDAAGSTDANDSDADASGNTIVTTLVSGENDLSWDAGLTAPAQYLTFDFQGNTALDGTDGNTRTYTNSGVSVNVSAFARSDSTGAWSKAYLGAYGGGLGVTDHTEGSGSGNTHTVDNVSGTDNYVVFTFNQAVTLDKAFLGYVSGDSDISVWIGNVSGAFTTPVNLTDAFLTGLGFKETNETTSTSARTADLNAGNRAGNVIVIAAMDNDTSPEDYFKLQNLSVSTFACAPAPVKGSIGDKVWADWDHDNIQDAGEGSVRNVRVILQNGSGVTIATTTTDVNGNYKFSNLDAGTYRVGFDKTNGIHTSDGASVYNWSWALRDQGSNDAVDSDASGSNLAVVYTNYFTLAAGANDMTRDAGVTPIIIDLNGDGVQTVSRAAAGGTFDLLGTGTAITSGWVSSSDGLLAIDSNGNGKIDDISELFGGTTKGDGFARLASFDSNGDGTVDSSDEQFAALRVWQDADGDHQTDAGELMSLAQAGVASLEVGYTELPFLDDNGNLHLERSSATMLDGKVVDMTDVYFNVDAADAEAAGVKLPTLAEMLGDDSSLDALLGSMVSTAGATLTGPTAPAASDYDASRMVLSHLEQYEQSVAA